MSFGEYADAAHDAVEEYQGYVAAGVIMHGPPTREQAAEDARLQAERDVYVSDLFDNDNPESLWYR